MTEEQTVRKPGPVETSVIADLDALPKQDTTGLRRSLREMALKLARAMDECETKDVAALSRANAELRQTLARLTGAGADDRSTLADFLRLMSTPVRDETVTGAADAGASRR